MVEPEFTADESPSKTKRFVEWQLTILASMYAGYAAFMLCRNTLISSSAAMMLDPSLDLDKESFGHLMSWHSAGAIAGKLVTGPGADWLGGRRMFLLALSLTAMANVGFAFGGSFAVFALMNFLGQFAKSGGWPAMTKMVGSWYPEHRYGQVWSLISTSSRVGTIGAGLVLGFALSLVSWRSIFLLSAAITLVVVAVLFFFLKEEPSDVGLPPLAEPTPPLAEPTSRLAEPKSRLAEPKSRLAEPKSRLAEPKSLGDDANASRADHVLDSANWHEALTAFARSGRFWSIGFGIVFLTIMMDFLVFIPIYLSESLGISGSAASMAGSSFPAGMFAALLLTSFVYDNLSKRTLVWALGGMLTLGCGCVIALSNLAFVSESIRSPVAIAVLFLLGLSISPAYYVPMSVFSVRFGGKHSGMLVSLIDVFGYCGAMLFNFFGGSIAEHYGWSVFLTGLLAISCLATLLMTTFLALDARSARLDIEAA
ncbi:Regulatory protein UhpC [Rubripirellula obstinata]|uniref:Regulatory protein UhpC n=1 Tax=Rubripirellula obstinata TaxID=406547 RepID=A0A5B1CEX0_9BACT|nr:MFS transporter [Rubripirellula obstinata]KAA1259698.1 Regulatory protein UhpC [Rubripirellula obstinata]